MNSLDKNLTSLSLKSARTTFGQPENKANWLQVMSHTQKPACVSKLSSIGAINMI